MKASSVNTTICIFIVSALLIAPALSIASSTGLALKKLTLMKSKGQCEKIVYNGVVKSSMTASYFVNDKNALSISLLSGAGQKTEDFKKFYFSGTNNKGLRVYSKAATDTTISVNDEMRMIDISPEIVLLNCFSWQPHICSYKPMGDNHMQLYIDDKPFKSTFDTANRQAHSQLKDTANHMTDGDCNNFGWSLKR